MIRHANKNEIEQILTIYFEAKKFLRQCGNFVQWQGNFPPKELLLNDIENNQLYVYENGYYGGHRCYGHIRAGNYK